MESVRILHLGCVSSVFLASKQGPDQDQKVVKAYHKGHLQVRHLLNITREVANLRHLKELRVPGVVDLCGTADDATNMYLVFEPCTGGDLYKRLAHRGLYDEAQLCKEVITPLLKVLHTLHKMGIIHRDIKPENLFFDGDGSLRVGDFGLAINSSRERPVSRVGTLDYMAPEVLAQPSADMIALRKIKPSQLPSYDCKVDIWALGVLVYEALMGMTPFSDADAQAASLKAQFRPPRPLPLGVSAECADFVAQALTKQACHRPSAAQLLAHPWVQAHVFVGDAHWCSGPTTTTTTHRLSDTSAASTVFTGDGTAHVSTPMHTVDTTGSPACTDHTQRSRSSGDTGSSGPCGPWTVLQAGSRSGLASPWAQMPAGLNDVHQHSGQLVLQKLQPRQTAPQQLPPHPFDVAAAQYKSGFAVGTLSGQLTEPLCRDSIKPDATSEDYGQQDLPTAPLPIPAQQPQPLSGGNRATISRQMSSPARLRDTQVVQEVLSSRAFSDLPSSPPAPSSGARLSALAMSPVRALLGAGRNLVRSRSGAAAPAAEGCAAAHSRGSSQPVMGFNTRGALPSPIRGLLQASRRRPGPPPSASLFAAAQWKPAGGTAGVARGSQGDQGASGVRFSGTASDRSSSGSCAGGKAVGFESSTIVRSCSMGPSVALGPELCSTSGSIAHDLPEADSCSSGAGSDSGCRNAAAAVAGIVSSGPHARQVPACGREPGGSHGEQHSYAGAKQQLALLNRYPSAPDPGPLLALSPVCGASRGAGMPPVSVPPCEKHGMRGMWLKVAGACRKVSKQCSRESLDQHPQDVQCMVARSP